MVFPHTAVCHFLLLRLPCIHTKSHAVVISGDVQDSTELSFKAQDNETVHTDDTTSMSTDDLSACMDGSHLHS
jgi:hypothetical protein